MMVAAEQSSGFDHGVSHRSAHLVEHQPFDRTELCPVAPVNAHMLDAVTGHQSMGHGVLPAFSPCCADSIISYTDERSDIRRPRTTSCTRYGRSRDASSPTSP